jgi:type III pantothenate kinase
MVVQRRFRTFAAYPSSVIVALDVGNTKIALGVMRGGDVTVARRAPTRPVESADDAERTLNDLLGHEGASLAEVSEVWLVSVVPAVAQAIGAACQRHAISLVSADATNVPLPVEVERSAEVGADRLVTAFAAALLYGTPVIAVSLGTATTFSVINERGAFVGGAIAPGLGLGLHALKKHTAQLPEVEIELPSAAIGRDTVSAIRSGAVLGHVALVDGLLGSIRAELGQPARVVLTGGLSALPWASRISGVDHVEPLLTLRGLALLKRELMALPKMAGAET